MTDEERLAAEQRARVLIDRQLTDAGWVVQDRKELSWPPRWEHPRSPGR
jgi:type I restriction enzyme R subunit